MLAGNPGTGISLRSRPGVAVALLLLVAFPCGAEEDRPPQGRSAFDRLFLREESGNIGYRIPFPFSRLIDYLDSRLDKSGSPLVGMKAVILPLGRSLQRRAGYPEVFRFPRVVIAADGELKPGPEGFGPAIRDRLYIGYNEKAGILEVISYNEDAGRFEFQVAHDYREGSQPRVLYANRKSCLACHQNRAPIFAEAPWDETQANAAVAEKLKEALGERYQGIRTSSGPDLPYDVDASKNRANMLLPAQEAWRRLCDSPRCRAALFREGLRMRLAGENEIRLKNLGFDFSRRWRKLWPGGLPIPNGQVPNRDPLFQKKSIEQLVEVESEFEPLSLREALEVWDYSEENVGRLFAGVARMIPEATIRAIREHRMAGRKEEDSLRDPWLRHAVAKVARSKPGLFSSGAFPQRKLMGAFFEANGWSYREDMVSDSRLPPVEVDEAPPSLKFFERQSELGLFRRCAACHNNTIGSPPNFLFGELPEVRRRISHCAERIFFRLSMWDLPVFERRKTPMPPLSSLEVPEEEWTTSKELRLIRAYVEKELKSRGVSLKGLSAKEFAQLPACLPEP